SFPARATCSKNPERSTRSPGWPVTGSPGGCRRNAERADPDRRAHHVAYRRLPGRLPGVDDVADQFLEDVLQGGDPEDVAVAYVHDARHVRASTLHDGQRVTK